MKFICDACKCRVHKRCDNVTHGNSNSCDCQHRGKERELNERE